MTQSDNSTNRKELGPIAQFVEAVRDEPFPERDFRKSEEELLEKTERWEDRRSRFLPDRGIWWRHRFAFASLCVLALIFAYIGLGRNGGEGDAAFAQILERIASIRSYQETATIVSPGEEDVVMSQFHTEGGMKSVREDLGMIFIENYLTGKVYVIQEQDRTITVRDGLKQEATQLPINTTLQEIKEVEGAVMSNEILDGSPVLCIQFKSPEWANEPVSSTHTYWIDEDSLLPVKILVEYSNGNRGTKEAFVFSEEVDDSILKIPEDYTVIDNPPSPQPRTVPKNRTEHEFVWGVWEIAKRNGKVFPSSITVEVVNRLWPNPEGDAENLTKSQALRACLFIQDDELRDFHYIGEGIPTGDRKTPVCWWHEVGSDQEQAGTEKYRVLFANCEVKTLTKRELDSALIVR